MLFFRFFFFIDSILVNRSPLTFIINTVEKTHWQKKAQSLSKDMLRLLGSATEAEELKGKLAQAQSRVEVRIMRRLCVLNMCFVAP